MKRLGGLAFETKTVNNRPVVQKLSVVADSENINVDKQRSISAGSSTTAC